MNGKIKTGQSILAIWAAVLLVFSSTPAFALDFDVKKGQMVQNPDGTYTVSGDTVIEGDFSVQNGQKIVIQGEEGAKLLWKDVSGNISTIEGQLELKNLVFALINKAGVTVGKNGFIDAQNSKLLLSTLDIKWQRFFKEQYKFIGDGGYGEIVNEGTVKVDQLVAFISNAIRNDGAVLAKMGTVLFGAGEQVAISPDESGMINVIVEKEYANSLRTDLGDMDQILNNGVVDASGGRIVMNAAATANLFRSAVRNTGEIHAGSIVKSEGRIFLKAQGAPVLMDKGSVLDVSAKEAGAKAGKIQVDADVVLTAGDFLTGATSLEEYGEVEMTGMIVTPKEKLPANTKVKGKLFALDDGDAEDMIDQVLSGASDVLGAQSSFIGGKSDMDYADIASFNEIDEFVINAPATR